MAYARGVSCFVATSMYAAAFVPANWAVIAVVTRAASGEAGRVDSSLLSAEVKRNLPLSD